MKIYIVTITTGSFGEYNTSIHKAFKDPLEAEKEKDFLKKRYKEKPTFPFEGEDEHKFFQRWENKGITEQEEKLYNQWEIEDYQHKEFCNAYVKEMELL